MGERCGCTGGGEAALGAEAVAEDVPAHGVSSPLGLVAREEVFRRCEADEPEGRGAAVRGGTGSAWRLQRWRKATAGPVNCAGTRRTRQRRSGGVGMAGGRLSTTSPWVARVHASGARGERWKGDGGGLELGGSVEGGVAMTGRALDEREAARGDWRSELATG